MVAFGTGIIYRNMKYTNRYNDEYTLTKTDEGVLWEGDFKHCRFSWPNDYTEAYNLYSKEEKDPVSLDDFKIKVHNHKSDTFKKYAKYVTSDKSKICVVDPSGGPYIAEGMNLSILGKEFKDMIVDSFEVVKNGYLIKVQNL